MKRLLSLLLMPVVLLGGCKSTPSREEVFVLDISQSIDADAERQMFVAVEDAAQHLQRGDSLTIIPITGNAVAELQGRTLRYAVPTADNRQAYDADLRNLNAQIKGDLTQLQADAVSHPGKHTDIIGSIRVAMKEFSKNPTDKRLIVLSDFIQDDQQFNFRKDPRLAKETDSLTLARSIAIPRGNLPSAIVILGRLRSSEFATLSPRRQAAIDGFWGQMMTPARVDPDGTAAVIRNLTK